MAIGDRKYGAIDFMDGLQFVPKKADLLMLDVAGQLVDRLPFGIR